MCRRLDAYNPSMTSSPKAKPRGPWTAEEIARNERANEVRAMRDREKSPDQRGPIDLGRLGED